MRITHFLLSIGKYPRGGPKNKYIRIYPLSASLLKVNQEFRVNFMLREH